MTLNKPSFILTSTDGKGESTANFHLDGRGVVIGSLLLAPSGEWNMGLEEKRQARHMMILHPQFPAEERDYLRNIIFISIKERIESLLQSLDDCRILENNRCSTLREEVGWMKEILAYYWPNETRDELRRVNDLADVLISRLIERSKIQVVEIVKLED